MRNMLSTNMQNYKKTWLLCLLLISTVCLSDAIRAKRAGFMDEDTTIRTEYVGNNRTIWAMFNLTDEQMGRIIAGNNASGKDQTAEARDSQIFDIIKRQRLNDIRNRIQNAFDAGNSGESQDHPQHEVAAYPICNAESNAASWLEDNNVTIQFANSIFEMKRENLNLDSAILRLFKMNPNGSQAQTTQNTIAAAAEQTGVAAEAAGATAMAASMATGTATATATAAATSADVKAKACAEPMLESQIRVTVSIIQQLRRNKQRKKRICNTIMLNVSKTGWVEIDIKRAIYIWETVMREQHAQLPQTRPPVMVGWLMIEVHDEEERPLKPGLFFKPPNCEQADLAIPWNYYGPHATMSSTEADQVPRYPRLDVRLIGYASFAPKNYDKNLNKKLHENIMRQLLNLSKSNHADIENEATTSNSPSVDNLLESLEFNEMPLHEHRKRHQQQQQQQQPTSTVSQTSNNADLNLQMQQQLQQQQEEQQHQHRRHRRHHHKHHHKHNVQQEQQQQ